MATETSYALTKYPPSAQYPYWEAGITRGSFSFRSSALSYLHRAITRAEVIEAFPQTKGGRLELVLNLGKAAHNLVTMDAVGKAHSAGKVGQVAAGFDMFYELAQGLSTDAPVDWRSLKDATRVRRETFDQLQGLQDAGDHEEFHALLREELEISANQFVSAAELYGWPEPGPVKEEIVAWMP